jgi:peptide/nickel transport system permease protein
MSTTDLADIHRRLRSRRLFGALGLWVGSAVTAVFVVMALAAPILAPCDPLANDWGAILQPPTWSHVLGTDDLGRDVLSRLIWGAQSSLIAGVGAVLIAMAIGVPLGIVSGFFRGWLDSVISRLADTLLACPQVMLAIALAMFLGGSLLNAAVAIGVTTIPVFIRLSRARSIQIETEVYIDAAISVGVGKGRLLFVHVLPNLAAPILVQASLTMAVAIIAEAGLSFLGLSRPLPAASWGSMLTVGKDYIEQAPWLSIWPGLCICLVVIAFNLLGDGLRKKIDPRG